MRNKIETQGFLFLRSLHLIGCQLDLIILTIQFIQARRRKKRRITSYVDVQRHFAENRRSHQQFQYDQIVLKIHQQLKIRLTANETSFLHSTIEK